MKIGVIMKNVDPPLYSPLDSKNSCVILERERERVRKSFCDDYSVENKKKKNIFVGLLVTNNERYDGGSFDSCQ